MIASSIRLFVTYILLSVTIIINAEEPKIEKPNISIRRSRLQTEIEVLVAIANKSNSDIVVPFCGAMHGQQYLCDLAVRLEVYSAHRWRPAIVKCNYCGLPGGIALEDCVTVRPEQTTLLAYQFAADYFRVARGQRVRLVLNVWPDKDMMKKRKAATEISSPAFGLP